MTIKPHDARLGVTTPRHRRESRLPVVVYSTLHHDLLKAVEVGAVAVHPANYHHILGFRVHGSVEEGLGWLLLGGHIEQADDTLPDGRRLVRLTPLGLGVLRRWDSEHGPIGRTGGGA